LKSADVSEEDIASIFRIEEKLAAYFVLVSSLADSSLKIQAMCSPKMSVDFHSTTRRYNPEDRILHFQSLLTFVI
jgi:hypothetical protein